MSWGGCHRCAIGSSDNGNAIDGAAGTAACGLDSLSGGMVNKGPSPTRREGDPTVMFRTLFQPSRYAPVRSTQPHQIASPVGRRWTGPLTRLLTGPDAAPSRASLDPRGGAPTSFRRALWLPSPSSAHWMHQAQPKRRPGGRIGAGTAARGLESVLGAGVECLRRRGRSRLRGAPQSMGPGPAIRTSEYGTLCQPNRRPMETKHQTSPNRRAMGGPGDGGAASPPLTRWGKAQMSAAGTKRAFAQCPHSF